MNKRKKRPPCRAGRGDGTDRSWERLIQSHPIEFLTARQVQCDAFDPRPCGGGR